MNAKQLKNSILQEAIIGRLVPQDPNDEPASALLERIRKEKERLVKEGKLKKKDLIETSISDDEKPFDIPESWEWVRLSSYLDVRDGTHDSPKYYPEGIPFVTSKNLDNGKIDFSSCKYISKEDHKKFSERSYVEDGDILFAMIGSIGNPVIVKKDREFSIKNVALFKRYSIELTDVQYIYYYLLFIQNELKKISSGGVQSFVGLKTFREWVFPLPPLAEQERIVAKLEELMPKIEEYGKAQAALDKLSAELPERLKKSILQEAICGRLVPQDPNDEPASVLLERIRAEKQRLVKEGKLKKKDLIETPISDDEKPFDIPDSWEWVPLSMISLDSADGPFGSNLKVEHYTEKKEVRIIQLSNIGEEGWRDKNKKYTTFKHLETIARSEAFPNDIIIAKMMPAGRAIICPSDDIKYVLSSDAVRFDFSKEIDREYLYFAINSNIFKAQVYDNVQGITRVRTSLTKLRSYILPLPPLAEQKRIVAKIEELFKHL